MINDVGVAPVDVQLAAHGLHPSDEEIAVYGMLAPLLRAMTDALYTVEIGEEL